MLPRAYSTAIAAGSTTRLVEGLTRDAVCARYQRKVVLVARKVFERLSVDAATTLEDLAAWGAIGLLEAFDRYDATRGIKFSTYAEYRIRGAIFDALRTHDTFSRRRRQLARRVEQATDEARRLLGRLPEPQEVADALEVDLDTYWSAVGRTSPVSLVSLEDSDTEGRPLAELIEDASSMRPGEAMASDEIRAELGAAIDSLPERQRQIVLMYYARDLSQAEIAAVYGVTVSRVCQVLTDARNKLKARLAAQLGVSDLAALEGR